MINDSSIIHFVSQISFEETKKTTSRGVKDHKYVKKYNKQSQYASLNYKML